MAPSPKTKHGLKQIVAALGQPRVAGMLALGFASGLPFLLSAATFSGWLAKEGVAVSTITFLSWVGFAYAIKFLWAPLVDRLPAPLLGGLGRRRGWVLLTQLIIAAALVGMAIAGPRGPGGLVAITTLAGVLAIASATQDTAVDAWRIESARDADDLTLLSSAFQLGYKIASWVTNAAILMLVGLVNHTTGNSHLGWPISYAVMGALMSVGMIAVLLTPEPAAADRVIEAKSPFWSGRGVLDAAVGPFVAFFREHGAFAFLTLLMLSLYRLPEFVIGPIALPFYIKGLGFDETTIGVMRGSVGLITTLAGVAAGGLSVAALGFRRTLILGAIMQGFGVASYALLALYNGGDLGPSAHAVLEPLGGKLTLFGVVLGFDDFTGAFGSVAFIAYSSTLTSLGYTVTQYAFLSSISTMLGKILKGFSGSVVDGLTHSFTQMESYAIFYAGAGLICLPAVALCLATAARAERASKGISGDVAASLFEGRATRVVYARSFVLTALVIFAVAWLGSFSFGDEQATLAARIALVVVGAATFIAVFMAATVRRLRDVGWNSRWVLLMLVPGANLVLLVMLAVAPGRSGPRSGQSRGAPVQSGAAAE
jgi:PAT family beta-lactamase induction signal transducer AmpG